MTAQSLMAALIQPLFVFAFIAGRFPESAVNFFPVNTRPAGGNTFITWRPNLTCTGRALIEAHLRDVRCLFPAVWAFDFFYASKLKAGEMWRNNETTGQHDLMFRQWDGKPLHPHTVSHWWLKYRERIGWVPAKDILANQKKGSLPMRKRTIEKIDKKTGEITSTKEVTEYYVLPQGIRFHDLRHTAATQMILEGVDVGTIADQLGQANKATTLNYYIGVVEEAKSLAANKMDSKFGKYVKNGSDTESLNAHTEDGF